MTREKARPETLAAPVKRRFRAGLQSTHCARAGRLPHLPRSETRRGRLSCQARHPAHPAPSGIHRGFRPHLWIGILQAIWFVALGIAAAPTASGGEQTQQLEQRLDDNPLDDEARLALADHLIAAGDVRLGRRHLRAFLRLHLEHPRRVEIARRVADLLEAHLWDLHEWDEGSERPPIYRNVIDHSLAVRIPDGRYRRILHPSHPVTGATVEARFSVDLPAFLADLHETPSETWQWFTRESGFSVPAYWGDDAESYRAAACRSTGHPWTWLGGTQTGLDLPQWPLTWAEARAVARWAGKRLPSEAEWEMAARGALEVAGEENPHPERRYPWGDAEPGRDRGNRFVNAGSDGVTSGDGERALPVDALPDGASPYGCRNMSGNVQEWCVDWYRDDDAVYRLPTTSPLVDSPTRDGETTRARVCKGGYFNWHAVRTTIDARTPHTYDSADMALLFKCGLRGFADAPPHPSHVEHNSWDHERRADPLDPARYLDDALRAEQNDRDRAWRCARAAARLSLAGTLRERALALLARTRPLSVWSDASGDGRRRNVVDGAVAARVGELLVDVHEVTEGRFLTFLMETARDPSLILGVNPLRFGNGDLPAATLSPEEAESYARWAGKRLPTRTEWREFARVDTFPYPWGAAPTTGRAALDSTHGPEISDDWDRRTSVNALAEGASPAGLLHLVGNVPELCADGPDDAERWLVGGTAAEWPDVQSPAEFRESLEESVGLDVTHAIQSRAYVGARCVADVPR